MFPQNRKANRLSGYLQLNENLQIEEFSGQINQILKHKDFDRNLSFPQLVNGLKKNLSDFFKNELFPAIEEKQIKHLYFERKNSTISISITPFGAGSILLSFEEKSPDEKQNTPIVPEHVQEIMIRINTDMQIVFISKSCYDKLAIKSSNILGSTLEDNQLFKENTPIITNIISRVFQHQKHEEIEIKLQKGDNQLWWNILSIPENDTANKPQSVLLILKDITKYKNIEEKLFRSEQRYLMAIEAADLGIWDFVVDTDKTFYSRRWKSILGYYPDELTDNYTEWEELLHPEDKDRVTRYMSNFLESDLRVFETEFRMKHKNGHYVWIKSRATTLRDENGKIIRLLGTHRDITVEKNSENEFKKLHQAILQSPVAVVITDHLGYIEFCNPAFCKITGWNDQEVIGKKPNILNSGFQPSSYYEKLWRTISAGNEWQGEFKNKKKNGELYWELASISPIRNNFGTITHYVKIAENITYLKKIEKDLKKAKQEAEVANNYKNHFLANMSHEIRTPINTIIGFSELIKNEGLLPQKRNKYSEIIEENSQSLLRLIDDIIDVAKIEANELKIKKEACPLGELFTELEMTYKNFLKRKQKQSIELKFVKPEETHHDIIFTDPYRLRQILNNLYLNALKHTEIGKIEVGYSIVNDTKLRFFVSDTGTGIPANRVNNIFKRYNYNDVSNVTDSVASGLGLSICKDLSILLGGDIQVKSVEGEGSVFYLSLPYDKIKIPMTRSAVKTTPQARYNFSNFTIMIAEDTPYNYEYLYSILEKTGATIVWAKDGIDVLKLYTSTKIDLILMDIQLPEISGYEATAQIRTTDQSLPIIAQTAYAMAEDRQKCLDAGCNEVLVKPMRMDEVLITVARFLNK